MRTSNGVFKGLKCQLQGHPNTVVDDCGRVNKGILKQTFSHWMVQGTCPNHGRVKKRVSNYPRWYWK